ncbi:MAG: 16S rRNA (adenine(1518)-N(6)/adenine(1519)-N(6))-dimethyltransferase RsmA [Bacteroidota bacterium]
MQQVRPKKSFGQHFLKDRNIALKIVQSLQQEISGEVIEIGPGTGVLTTYLNEKYKNFQVIEVDDDSVEYLKNALPELKIIHKDILKINLSEIAGENMALIGNLPYNISSQIFFKVLDNREFVDECVFMVQKEVADRICSPAGNKTYGILSVLMQAYFEVKYLFTVSPGVFHPPPKVKSAVMRLKRNKVTQYPCDESLFFALVKSGFNHRRKTLRNAIKNHLPEGFSHSLLNKRAEQLEVVNFVALAQAIEAYNS